MSAAVGRTRTEAVSQRIDTAGPNEQAGRWVDQALVGMTVKNLVSTIGVADRDTERFEAFTQEMQSAECAGCQGQKPYAIGIDPGDRKRGNRCAEREARAAYGGTSSRWCLRGHDYGLNGNCYLKVYLHQGRTGNSSADGGKVDAVPMRERPLVYASVGRRWRGGN